VFLTRHFFETRCGKFWVLNITVFNNCDRAGVLKRGLSLLPKGWVYKVKSLFAFGGKRG